MSKTALLALALVAVASVTLATNQREAAAVAAAPHATYYAQYLNGTCYIHQWEANGTHNILTNWLCAPVGECYEIAYFQNANAAGVPLYYN